MSSLRSSCQLPLSPPLAKLPALAAPKQNLELGMGKGVPARERAGTKYRCLFFTVVFFFPSDSAVVRMEHSSVDSPRLSLAQGQFPARPGEDCTQPWKAALHLHLGSTAGRVGFAEAVRSSSSVVSPFKLSLSYHYLHL